jgi:broad specificity phosphatase PhoE
MSPSQSPPPPPSQSPPETGGGGGPRPFPPHPLPHPGWGRGTHLWLTRHAEVHEQWQGRAYGDLDVPLSASGEERTGEMGRSFGALPLDLVATSPLGRARRLGEEVARRSGAPLVEEADLREIHRGSWQGLEVEELHERFAAEVRAFHADPWSWAGHGGENDEAICARGWRALGRSLERAAGGTLLVATHYNVIRVIVASALGIPPARSFALRIDLGRAALLVDAPDGWRLENSNLHAPPSHTGDA